MSAILEKYVIEFVVQLIEGENQKLFTCPQEFADLAVLCEELENFESLQGVINNIQTVLNDSTNTLTYQEHTESACIFCSKTNAQFWLFPSPFDYDNPELEIPTQDLRDILVEWKKFLSQP